VSQPRSIQIHRRVNLPDWTSHEEVLRARLRLEDEYWDLRTKHNLSSKSDFDLGHLPGQISFGWVAHTIV
jgi:hypothetical protein